ncbi:MAG: VOC family protein [Parvibaculaceae bacterium]|jgi:PhnB protein
MKVQAYLSFEGRCEEAIAFYQKTLGAKPGMLMRWKECPDKEYVPKGIEEKVMHSSFHIGDTEVMASDGYAKGNPTFNGISLTLAVKDVASANKYFEALTDGGSVQMPIAKTFFAPAFGTLTDKFGVTWMVIAQSQ